jgi:hypothetical protein
MLATIKLTNILNISETLEIWKSTDGVDYTYYLTLPTSDFLDTGYTFDPGDAIFFQLRDIGQCNTVLLLILDCDKLRITNVVTNCTNSTINITITGGIAPYYYSVDNGKTLIQSTEQTYQFTDLTGGIYDVYVSDSNTSFDMWVEQNCNPVTVIFETVFLTQYSIGQIYDENFVPYTTSFSVTKDKDTLYNTSSTSLNGSSFLGWSLVDMSGNKPSKSQMNKVNYLTKNSNYTHLFDHNTTVYAIFDKSGPEFLDFCYFPTPVGYAATEADLEYYCPNCSQTVRVYYNESLYNTIGFEKITWYKDVNLTTPVDTGYYKLLSDTKTLIYRLANGLATYSGSCPNEPKLLTCC